MKSIAACLFLIVIVPQPNVLAQSSRTARPNIIYIMSDDHAAHAIGAYGSRVNRTPNIDRLAREGALLERVMATNSICCLLYTSDAADE